MPHTKPTSFIAELADLMDKYDVHFIIDDKFSDEPTELLLIQNDWNPMYVPYDWRDGNITADDIRNTKIE
jgi:hypothetical protein